MKSQRLVSLLKYLNFDQKRLEIYLEIEKSYGLEYQILERGYYFEFLSEAERTENGPGILQQKSKNKEKIYVLPGTESKNVINGMSEGIEQRIRVFGAGILSEACVLLRLTALNQVIAL